MTFEGRHNDLTEMIIGAFYKVYNQLGYGFSEKVYENALVIELCKHGLDVVQQAAIRVYYENALIGEFSADLLINQTVIVELKAVHHILEENEAQLLNYLKATQIEVGLLLNFGPKAQVKRKIFDNARKGDMSWIKNQDQL
ncbi:MAG: GxxExxY protein [Chloroflexi bacterium RBG_16_54_18]|nr:MAG: GxxExxY protein [Chloroflexi bacterium RBG_16_54_18]